MDDFPPPAEVIGCLREHVAFKAALFTICLFADSLLTSDLSQSVLKGTCDLLLINGFEEVHWRQLEENIYFPPQAIRM